MVYSYKAGGIVKSKHLMLGIAAASVITFGGAVPVVGALSVNGGNGDSNQSSSDSQGKLEVAAVGGGGLQGSSYSMQGGDNAGASQQAGGSASLGANVQASGASESQSSDDDSSRGNAALGADTTVSSSAQTTTSSQESENNDDEQTQSSTDLQGGLNLDLNVRSASSSNDDGLLGGSLLGL